MFVLLVPRTALVILLPRGLVKHRWIQTPLPALCLPQSRQASHASPHGEHGDLTLRNWRPPANPLLASPTEGSRPHRLSCPLFNEGCSLLGKCEACFGMQGIEKKRREESCIVVSPFLAALWVNNGLLSPGLLSSSKCPQRKQTTAQLESPEINPFHYKFILFSFHFSC